MSSNQKVESSRGAQCAPVNPTINVDIGNVGKAENRIVRAAERTPHHNNTYLLPSCESRFPAPQRLNELASGSVNVVKLTPACVPTPPPRINSRVRKQSKSRAESKRVYERSVSVVELTPARAKKVGTELSRYPIYEDDSNNQK